MGATIATTDTRQTIELDPHYMGIDGLSHPYDIDADMCALVQYEGPYRDDEGTWHMDSDEAQWRTEYADLAPEIYEAEHALLGNGYDWDELMAIKDGCETPDMLQSMDKYLGKLRKLTA